jgi:hypothetical protein
MASMPLQLRPAVYALNWESFGCPSTQMPPDWGAELTSVPPPPHAFRVACPPDPVRLGMRSARFELHQGDVHPDLGTRAELTSWPEPIGTTRWYGFSIYLPVGWTSDQSGEILAQWHQAFSKDPKLGGSPPLAIMTRAGKWVVSVRKAWNNEVEKGTDDKEVGDYELGTWTDWVVSVLWSEGQDGTIRIWKNGRTVYRPPNPGQNKFADGQGNYMKFGIYKWNWIDTSPRFVFHDELRMSNELGSFIAVSPDRRWFLDWLLEMFRDTVVRMVGG